ncbi:MAG TPA: hypothetical protein V6C95_07780 [Coleofasciculaceae cyanobacterium]
MISSCHNPLPLDEHATAEVLIYAYEGGWVPIRFSSLGEAINLYHNALLHGVEIFVFPSDSGITDH